MTIRDLAEADLPRLLLILNDAIAHTTARWTDTPETLDGARTWLTACQARGLPVTVAEQGGVVVGFGSLQPFRVFPGFRFTIEHALYVDPANQRRGLGRALLAALEDRARAGGMHAMIGAIAAENEASLALHRRAQFEEVGRLPEIGFKFGRWLDLVLMQKML